MRSQLEHREHPGLQKAHLPTQTRWINAGLAGICLLYSAIACIGITWGLPSRKIDSFLFGEGEVWPGDKIYRLARAEEKFSTSSISSSGADVDVNPLNVSRDPIELTATKEDVARIYLRYRLYTYQPDEMITMMALAGMRPSQFQLDPRLYQYGGLFIYPVGGLIKLCGMLGLIDVRSDIVFYLDNPDEFGKFYVVARAYSAAWGLVGVVVVFALTRRMVAGGERSLQDEILESGKAPPRTAACGGQAGLIAALLFSLLPVVVCMSHEGKPHLPGAVLMLIAVYFGLRSVENSCLIHDAGTSKIPPRKFFWWMCACCGAAVGIVLSSWPICVLIPLVAMMRHNETWKHLRKTFGLSLFGGGLAVAVYFVTNPYVVINLFTNLEILRSNFGNSLAMYEVDRIREGFVRVLELTVSGASLPVLVLGIIALFAGIYRLGFRNPNFRVLVVPSIIFFVQFVLIGAGKPPEYGRFGVFPDTALVVASAMVLASRAWSAWLRGIVFAILLFCVGLVGLRYLQNFKIDSTPAASRLEYARLIRDQSPADEVIAVEVEPAPYSCPPMNFASKRLLLIRNPDDISTMKEQVRLIRFDSKASTSPISWANVPLLQYRVEN